jgi:hypothetical protein
MATNFSLEEMPGSASLLKRWFQDYDCLRMALQPIVEFGPITQARV